MAVVADGRALHYRRCMEQSGCNTFFTLAEARDLATRALAEVRAAMIPLSRRRAIDNLYVSHGTLLQLSGCTMRLDTKPSYDKTAIHLTVDDPKLLSRPKGFRFHYWSSDIEPHDIDELLVGVSPMQAVCQLARFVDLTGLVMLMDWLTCRNPQLRICSHQELADYIDGLGQFAGARLCRKAIGLSMENTDSPPESVLRLRGHGYGFRNPVPNHAIIDPISGKAMHVDIAYPDDHVVIEYDGRYHYTMDRWEFDLDKRNRIRAAGYQPFVATRADMATEENLNAFFSMVARAMMRYRMTGAFE